MTYQTLPDLLELLTRATRAEEVFGKLDGDQHSALKRIYRELVTLVHPDVNQGQVDQANEAFKRLQHWYAEAQRRVSFGSYGKHQRISARTRLHAYVGYEAPLAGDLCDLYPADGDGTRVLLKVARSHHDNDLLQAEAQALRALDAALQGQPLRAHFPTLVEHFLLRDQSGVQRHANVLLAESACVSLADVLRAYPQGLDLADAAWMFNRLLAALAFAHSVGLVHGAVLPAHVLIRPADHNGMLIDWCYSVPAGETIKAISPAHAGDYPPEVPGKQPASPATDLYMAARLMLRLLGASGPTLELPLSVPRPIQTLLRSCLIPSPHRRPGDGWQLFDDFQEVLSRLYGKRKFRPFHMPAVTSHHG